MNYRLAKKFMIEHSCPESYLKICEYIYRKKHDSGYYYGKKSVTIKNKFSCVYRKELERLYSHNTVKKALIFLVENGIICERYKEKNGSFYYFFNNHFVKESGSSSLRAATARYDKYLKNKKKRLRNSKEYIYNNIIIFNKRNNILKSNNLDKTINY